MKKREEGWIYVGVGIAFLGAGVASLSLKKPGLGAISIFIGLILLTLGGHDLVHLLTDKKLQEINDKKNTSSSSSSSSSTTNKRKRIRTQRNIPFENTNTYGSPEMYYYNMELDPTIRRVDSNNRLLDANIGRFEYEDGAVVSYKEFSDNNENSASVEDSMNQGWASEVPFVSETSSFSKVGLNQNQSQDPLKVATRLRDEGVIRGMDDGLSGVTSMASFATVDSGHSNVGNLRDMCEMTPMFSQTEKIETGYFDGNGNATEEKFDGPLDYATDPLSVAVAPKKVSKANVPDFRFGAYDSPEWDLPFSGEEVDDLMWTPDVSRLVEGRMRENNRNPDMKGFIEASDNFRKYLVAGMPHRKDQWSQPMI